jgi:hypothetical protein
MFINFLRNDGHVLSQNLKNLELRKIPTKVSIKNYPMQELRPMVPEKCFLLKMNNLS